MLSVFNPPLVNKTGNQDNQNTLEGTEELKSCYVKMWPIPFSGSVPRIFEVTSEKITVG
jgi:hypothetical protein